MAEAGHDPDHDYSVWRWLASRPDFHTVADGFPRIATPLPPGVSDVTCFVALAACEPFRTSWDEISAILSEEKAR